MSKLILRALLGLFGLIALVTGGVGAFMGTEGIAMMADIATQLDLSSQAGATIDNEFRYFGGTWVGVGVMLLYATWKWPESAVLIRFAALAIFIGGLGRLTPWVMGGMVPDSLLAPIVLEVIVMPALVFWDSRMRAKQAT